MNRMGNNYGQWAFMAGIGLAVITSFFTSPMLLLVMGLAGIVVGVMNIGKKETTNLLLWVMGLGLVGVGSLATSLALVPLYGEVIAAVLTNIGAFFTVVAVTFLVVFGWRALSK